MNALIPSPQGGWWWDGCQWQCAPDCGPPCPPPGPPCPPASFPPPGCPPWFPPPQGQPPWYPGANAGVSFGTTAPSNPVRGHFWYDGQTLWIFDGATWVDVGIAGVDSLVGIPPVTVKTTPPYNPKIGNLWFNPDTGQLLLWLGTSWLQVGGVSGGGGGVVGVTDGSNVAPGIVGEFVTGSGTMGYAANPVNTSGSITPIVLQPGDWHCTVGMSFSTYIGSAEFQLSPQPTGVSNDMGAVISVISNTSATQTGSILIGRSARANISVPTALAFSCTVFQSGDVNNPAGVATLSVEARRVR